MIESIRSKALRQFWTKGDSSALKPEWRKKAQIVLNALHNAKQPESLNLPGFGFHALTGDMAGRFSIIMSRTWRITFGWRGEDATEVDLEDYHGD